MKMLTYFLCFIILSLSFPCTAQIFEYSDYQDNKVFSDSPPSYVNPADVISIGKPSSRNTYQNQNPSPAIIHLDTTSKDPQIAMTNLTSSVFMVHSPIEQQIFKNTIKIPVTVSMQPTLQDKHSIQIFIDGVPYLQPASKTEFFVDNLSLGTHTVHAQLLGTNKEIIKSSQTVTFFIHPS